MQTHRGPAGPLPGPGLPIPIAATIVLLCSFGPFAIDLYLPALPALGEDLGTTPSGAQLTLTAVLIGIALGQLAFGIASDRWGRRTPLLIGAAGCLISSIVAALAPSLGILVAARFAQGLTGAAGVVIGRALVADLTSGRETARWFTLVATVSGFAPVIAPAIGGFLTNVMDWRGMLWIIAAIAGVMLVASGTLIPRTQMPDGSRPSGERVRFDGPRFLGYGATFVLGFASLMAYIAASPYLYQQVIGLSPSGYGLAFAVNALLGIAAGAVSAKLVRRVGPRPILGAGLGMLLTGNAAVLGLAILPGGAPWAGIPLLATNASIGLIFGNATALALESVRASAGTGAAILGCAQFTAAAAVSPLAGLSEPPSILSFAVTAFVSAAAATVAFLLASRARPTQGRDVRGP